MHDNACFGPFIDVLLLLMPLFLQTMDTKAIIALTMHTKRCIDGTMMCLCVSTLRIFFVTQRKNDTSMLQFNYIYSWCTPKRVAKKCNSCAIHQEYVPRAAMKYRFLWGKHVLIYLKVHEKSATKASCWKL